MSPIEAKDKVIVRFDKAWRAYAPGERASFSWDLAGKLVKGGVAKYDDPDLKKGKKPKLVEEEEPESKDTDTRTYGKSIEQVQDIIDSIDDPDELERLWAGEIENPQHENGRKGVLAACRARAQEIKEGNTSDDDNE